MADEPDDDRPWTEERWLAEFRRSDVRSARFGELLETLIDHPDRDAIIEREMGWDLQRDVEEGGQVRFPTPLSFEQESDIPASESEPVPLAFEFNHRRFS